jgi:hypothetical protein
MDSPYRLTRRTFNASLIQQPTIFKGCPVLVHLAKNWWHDEHSTSQLGEGNPSADVQKLMIDEPEVAVCGMCSKQQSCYSKAAQRFVSH